MPEQSASLRALALVCSLKPSPAPSVPAQGRTHWNGAAMQSTDHNDLDEVPAPVASVTAACARNAAHLASVLKKSEYPPYE